jgi:hypothetical protein
MPTIQPKHQQAVLKHLARYRLSVFSALKQSPELATLSSRGLRKLLEATQAESLVRSAPLRTGARYWYLTERGAAACGLPPKRSGPLAESAKIRAYALLAFCCLLPEKRHRFTKEEMHTHLAELAQDGMPDGYYLQFGATRRLGLARVDAGRQGRWDRVIESLREDISRHWEAPAFRALMEQQRFEITVLTIFPHKAARLRSLLASYPDTQRVPIQVPSLPLLLPLVASTRSKEVRRKT